MGKARPLRQWINKAAGTVNECGAQSFHAGQFVGVGALGRARFGQPDSLEPKADDEIMGQHRQLLPYAVTCVTVGGHRVKREFSFEFGEGLRKEVELGSCGGASRFV
jgi:hypothetical protein